MSDGDKVKVERRVLEGLRAQLLAERKSAKDLQRRLDEEVRIAHRAMEETLKARNEREEYRRVLAAAVTNEKQAVHQVAATRDAFAALEARLHSALVERGEATGRSQELEDRLGIVADEHQEALRHADERSWSMSDEHGREMRRAVYERGLALGQVRELLERVAPITTPSARAARMRGAVNLGIASVAAIAALIVLVGLGLALPSPERALQLGALTGMTPWQMIGLEIALITVTLGLGTWGIREWRVAEREQQDATRKAVRAQAAAEVAPLTPESAG
tara:strand:- start:2138 stop:2968 length:831 start_codon:yes stop_codon:yes gene_type:complete